jgi:hypothetical protein
MPGRAKEAGISACGHYGRCDPCIKVASYEEPLCVEPYTSGEFRELVSKRLNK